MWRYLLAGFLIGVITTLLGLHLLQFFSTEELEEIDEVSLDEGDLDPIENFSYEQTATPSVQLQDAQEITNF